MTASQDDCLQEAPPAHVLQDALSGKTIEDTSTCKFWECVSLYMFLICFAPVGRPHFGQPVCFAGWSWIHCWAVCHAGGDLQCNLFILCCKSWLVWKLTARRALQLLPMANLLRTLRTQTHSFFPNVLCCICFGIGLLEKANPILLSQSLLQEARGSNVRHFPMVQETCDASWYHLYHLYVSWLLRKMTARRPLQHMYIRMLWVAKLLRTQAHASFENVFRCICFLSCFTREGRPHFLQPHLFCRKPVDPLGILPCRRRLAV